MKKIIMSLVAAAAVMVFSGCSANDKAIQTGALLHDVAKAGYQLGGKELFNGEDQKRLEASSVALDVYGETREVVRDMQDGKKPDADTSPVLEN